MKHLKHEHMRNAVRRDRRECPYLSCFLCAENAIYVSEVPLCYRIHTSTLQLLCVYVFNSHIVKKKAEFMLSAPALYYALHSKKCSDIEELWHEIENKKPQLNYL